MLRRNKLTKTLAFPIATGAAAIGVLAGSVLIAFDPVGMLSAAGSFTYTIEILDPNFHFTGAQVDSDVNVNPPLGYGTVTTFLQEPNLTLISLNGWPAPPAPGSFIPITGDLKKLTVTNTLAPNPGGTLMSSSNKFTQGTEVPEPGTILGLLTVGGLGLVSRFKR